MAGHFRVNADANNIDIGAIGLMGFEYTNASDDVAVDVVWAGGTGTTSSGENRILSWNYLRSWLKAARSASFGEERDALAEGNPRGVIYFLPNLGGEQNEFTGRKRQTKYDPAWNR